VKEGVRGGGKVPEEEEEGVLQEDCYGLAVNFQGCVGVNVEEDEGEAAGDLGVGGEEGETRDTLWKGGERREGGREGKAGPVRRSSGIRGCDCASRFETSRLTSPFSPLGPLAPPSLPSPPPPYLPDF